MYRSKAIEQLAESAYDVDGTGLQYYQTNPPGGPLPFGSVGDPFFHLHHDHLGRPTQSIFHSDEGLTHRFRAGPHEGFGRDHINYETYAGPISGVTLLDNVHIDVPVAQAYYDKNGDIRLSFPK